MNNKEKFRNSVEKINIDEDLVNQMTNRIKNEFGKKNVVNFGSDNVIEFKSKDKKNNRVRNVKGEDENMKKGKILKFIKTISLSAAAMVVITIVGVGSYATISGDTRILKNFGVNLEGMEENIEVAENTTNFESGVSYTIDYEGSMILSKQENMDIYESPYNEPENEKFNVYMKIYSMEDDKCEELCKELKVETDKMNSREGYEAENTEEVTIGKGNYKATRYWITDDVLGPDTNARIRTIYIIKVGNKQNLIIETDYLVEAEEGWGDTFRQLLSTLEIKNYKQDEVQDKNETINNSKDTMQEEKIPGTYEGMKNKFEDPGTITIVENECITPITGGNYSYCVAKIDLLNKKGLIALYVDSVDDEETKITNKKEIALSEEEAERLYKYYEERLENKSRYDWDSLDEYRVKEGHSVGLEDSIEQAYFYSFEADGVSDVYVFGNAEDIQFLYNLFDGVR